MMKKLTSIMLTALLIAGAVGCGSAETDDASTDAGTTAATTEAVSGTTAESGSAAPEITEPVDNTPGVEAYTEAFVNGECSVTLTYPRFGDGEHEQFDISMRNYANQEFSQSGMMPEDSAVYEITSLDITYASDKLVSAVAVGHIINTTSANETDFAYTVNADPATGRIYGSEELVGDVDAIKTALTEGKFSQSYGMDGLMDAIADEVITYEDITGSWRSDYGVFPDMYFTGDTFGVIAELPHVAGGYAGFEILTDFAGEMINDTAKGLLSE